MMAVINKLIIVFYFVVIASGNLQAQLNDSTTRIFNQKRLNTFIISSTVGYGATLIGLNQLWYANTERQSFRFFNDNAEWNQVDKLGHFYSSFYFSYGTSQALKWVGLADKKSNLWGSITGLAILVPLEIFDGFSASYGASYGDLIADAAGSAFFLGQTWMWNEVRIYPKFSFHQTSFAPLRPNILGKNLTSEILKDYNGQTYWLSFDIDKFIAFPKWINLAIGYGANGMVYGRNSANVEAGYHAYRQLYIGIDFDFSGIHTRSKIVRSALFLLNLVKLPAPAIELSKKGSSFYPFYF